MYKKETELYDMLKRKMDILQKISTNTQIQLDFIYQRKMKGLLRLLEEQDQYLQELETLNQALDGKMIGMTVNDEIRSMLHLIEVKHFEAIRDNKTALAGAEAEKDRIAADLHRVSKQIKLRNSYDCQRINFIGSQLNQNG